MKSRRSTRPPDAAALPDEQALYEAAVRALARRARSTNEVRTLLAHRKGDKKQIAAVLKRLKENGYLDDARFARSFADFRLETEGFGSRRVRRDLAARRLHPELIEKAVRAAYDDVDEGRLLRDYLRRKVRLTHPPEKPSALASLYRRLLRAGFASDTILRELRAMGGTLARRPRSGRATIDPEKWQEWLDALAEAPEEESKPTD